MAQEEGKKLLYRPSHRPTNLKVESFGTKKIQPIGTKHSTCCITPTFKTQYLPKQNIAIMQYKKPGLNPEIFI